MDPGGLSEAAFQVAPSQLPWRRQSCSCPKVPLLHRCGGLGASQVPADLPRHLRVQHFGLIILGEPKP